MKNLESQPIQVVDRTLDILEFLAEQDKPMRSVEIAEHFNISSQRANNLLRTLYRRGYISQDNNRSYRLGVQCFLLGSKADRWHHLRLFFEDAVSTLPLNDDFCGFAGIIEADKLLCLALAKENLQYHNPPQTWGDELHSTACGRILLAALTTEERNKLFARTLRRKMTNQTIVDVDKLNLICEKIKQDGFSEVCNESRDGISSMAIPVKDVIGNTIAALAISANNTVWKNFSQEEKLNRLLNTRKSINIRSM